MRRYCTINATTPSDSFSSVRGDGATPVFIAGTRDRRYDVYTARCKLRRRGRFGDGAVVTGG